MGYRVFVVTGTRTEGRYNVRYYEDMEIVIAEDADKARELSNIKDVVSLQEMESLRPRYPSEGNGVVLRHTVLTGED